VLVVKNTERIEKGGANTPPRRISGLR
jgi:hypothetical protein